MEFPTADPSPDALLMSRELATAIAQVVKALPRKLRDPFLLAASGDHRYEEIATLLGIADRHREVAHLRSAPPDSDEARSARPRRSAMNQQRDLSAEARSAKVDRLDEAIDHVAARLTHIEDNPALTSRIVSSLPERAGWFGWLFHSWAPRLAMIAIVVASGIVWSSRRPEVPSPNVDAIGERAVGHGTAPRWWRQ